MPSFETRISGGSVSIIGPARAAPRVQRSGESEATVATGFPDGNQAGTRRLNGKARRRHGPSNRRASLTALSGKESLESGTCA
jgi:hypothetical protein